MRETRKNQIIQATLHLLKTHNFDEISIADICREAQIGKSTLYNYFKSKDDILLNFEYPLHDEILTKVPIIMLNGTPYSQYLQIMGIYADYFFHLPVPLLRKMLSSGVNQHVNNFTPKKDHPLYQITLALLEKAQQLGEVRSDLSADSLCGTSAYLLTGICYAYCAQNGDFDFEEAFMQAIHTFTIPENNRG